MATFEETWENFKKSLKEHVPDWNTQFLNWADARGFGFGFGGGFFNEFPHTHTYETDLSWLISRMKWVLFRMDSVEERMKLVEEMLINFVESLDIDQVIKDELQRLIDDGTIGDIIAAKIIELTQVQDWGTPVIKMENSGWRTSLFTRSGVSDLSDKYVSTSGFGFVALYKANQKKKLVLEMPPTKMGNTSSLIDNITTANNFFLFEMIAESTSNPDITTPFIGENIENFGKWNPNTTEVHCNWGGAEISTGYVGSTTTPGLLRNITVLATPTNFNRSISTKRIELIENASIDD